MRRALVLVCLALLAATLVGPPAHAAPDPPTYVPPVDAPVVDGFRPPATPYGPGNRGVEYGTQPGTTVVAAADGVVTFAGRVAGSQHVTLEHPDGLRTTYSFLAAVDVVVGQRVDQGDVVGRTADHLHLGARRGDAYFDPLSLFAGEPPHVRLVPFDEPPGEGAGGERSAVEQLIGGVGDLLGTGVGWLRSGSQLLDTFGHYTMRFVPPMSMVQSGLTMYTAWQTARRRADRACSADDVVPSPPTGRRVALLVAGLGSNSRDATIDDVDTVGLGYADPDVVRFSYAGGRTPDPTDGLRSLPSSDYGPAETLTDLRIAGDHLANLIEDVSVAEPGVPIDVYAHSQGGVVTRVALIELERRHGVAWLERLGLVATLGSPHGGADLATAAYAVNSTGAGSLVLDVIRGTAGMSLSADAVGVEQLAETSDLIAELRAHPVPEVVQMVSIAARGDLVVALPSTRVPAGTEAVVPLAGPDAHTDLPGSPEATRELHLALAELPPGCQSFSDALLDEGMGGAISYAEDMVGAAGWLVTGWSDIVP